MQGETARTVLRMLHDRFDEVVVAAQHARGLDLITAMELKAIELFHETIKDIESTWSDIDQGPAPF